MAKSVKLKNDVYLNSSSVTNNRIPLNKTLCCTNKYITTGIGWYRVAVLDGLAGTGNIGGLFLIDLHTFYQYENNMSALLCINMAHLNVAITNLASAINTKVVDAIRVVRDVTNKKLYLDVHYATNAKNTVYINIIQFTDIFYLSDWTLIQDVPDNILTTFNI